MSHIHSSAGMNQARCPICHQPVEPEGGRKAHLETHRLDEQDMIEIALHIINLEDKIMNLEHAREYQANENRQRQRGEEKDAQQSKTITMAEELKYKSSLQKKAKLGDGSNIAAEDR
jgi:hypothetical protein